MGDASAGLPSNPKPWSEVSLAASGFFYKGKGVIDPADPTHDPFHVAGGDIALIYLDATARAGYTDRKDDHLFVGDASSTKIKNQFVELSCVAFPWLVPSGRWESVKVGHDTSEQLSLTVNGLARANVKSFVAANWIKQPHGKFVNEGGTLGVLIGF
jgi:hypothetical protein